MESIIQLLVEKGETLLFLKNSINPEKSFYELPSGSVYPDESQQQALQRILMETVRLSLKNVVKVLPHKDSLDANEWNF